MKKTLAAVMVVGAFAATWAGDRLNIGSIISGRGDWVNANTINRDLVDKYFYVEQASRYIGTQLTNSTVGGEVAAQVGRAAAEFVDRVGYEQGVLGETPNPTGAWRHGRMASMRATQDLAQRSKP